MLGTSMMSSASKEGGAAAIENIPGLADLKGLELEEEAQQLTAENFELRFNMKELVEKNTLLQLRVVELNELVRDLSQAKAEALINNPPVVITSEEDNNNAPLEGEAPESIAKLKQENMQLKRQLSIHQTQQETLKQLQQKRSARKRGEAAAAEDDEPFDSFLNDIEVA